MSEAPKSFMAGGVRLTKWCREAGVSRQTAYRWRKAGLLRTCQVGGVVCVTREASEEFWRNAKQTH